MALMYYLTAEQRRRVIQIKFNVAAVDLSSITVV